MDYQEIMKKVSMKIINNSEIGTNLHSSPKQIIYIKLIYIVFELWYELTEIEKYMYKKY